jgi:hypothetical protein
MPAARPPVSGLDNRLAAATSMTLSAGLRAGVDSGVCHRVDVVLVETCRASGWMLMAESHSVAGLLTKPARCRQPLA